jgi:hypothetical protein
MAIIVPLKSAFDDRGIKDATKSIKGFAKIATAAIGIAAIGSFLGSSAKAATEDVKSQAMLARQLKATTGATANQVKQVEASISSMESMAAVADDNIRPAFAQLTRATGDVGKATELTRLALDVSAGTGKDLSAVTIALGKAYQGNTAGLQKLGINVKGMKNPMEELKKQFKGAAQTAANNDPYAQMAVAFDNIQEAVGMSLLPVLKTVTDITPQIQNFFTQLTDPATQAGSAWQTFTSILGGLFKLITDNIGFVTALGLAIIGYTIVTKAAAIAQALFDVALGALNPVSLAIGLGVLAGSLMAVSLATNTVANDMGKLPGATGKVTEKLQKQADDLGFAYQAWANEFAIFENNAGQQSVWYYISQHQSQFDAAVAQETARLRKWTEAQKVANAQAIISHQQGRVYDPNWQPKNVMDQRALDATTAAKEQSAKAKLAAEQAAKTLADAKKALADAVKDFVSGLSPAKLLPRQLGEIENGIVDSFKAINDKLKTAFDAGAITKKALANLQKFADGEESLLSRIARKRDEIAQSITTAKDLIQSTKDAFSTAFDVTSLTPGAGMFDQFKTILEKTKAFYKNLKQLQAMNLNKGLFASIVAGGIETGGATAQAIIDSGASGVASLNQTANELASVAGGIGETAAQVAYGSGVDVSKGLVAGLLSQDSELVRVATILGSSFKAAFSKASKGGKFDMKTAMSGLASASDVIAPLLGGNVAPASSQINVTVNAGMGADGDSIAKMLVTTLKKYERTNGAVWQSA